MDLSNITRLISSLRAQTARDSITPDGLGSILQRIVDAISSMSGIDVEDENAILQRLSTAESDAQTALQIAQNAQTGAAGNVIDSFTAEQTSEDLALSLKQHGYAAKQVVLPAASSTGAGIMTSTDKSHLGTAYGKRVTLMNTLSSAAEVTLQLTFGDGSTKVVTFVGAVAGNGGKAGLMTKEQADQLAALVAAGTAESVRDDAGYIKQQYAAPVVLRNVSDEEVDDLSVGDIFYDAGNLWQCGASENTDMGAPSKKVIYYCLADQMLYRWTGSRFVQAVRISSGDIAVPTKLSDLINDMGFLTTHQPLKTINGQTITGTGNITIDGAAELKDASNHIKQSMAAPMVLRNVTNEEVADLSEEDVFFDSGVLWYCGASGNVSLGSPSKSLIYYCRGDQKFYRWNGSSFTAASSSSGVIAGNGITKNGDVISVDAEVVQPVTADGTFAIRIGNNTYTVNLNHSHPQYLTAQSLKAGSNVSLSVNQQTGEVTISATGGGGGGTQVQADWNQTDSTAVDFIKNKPTIPVVPTAVSAFTNDAGYLTQHQSLAGRVQSQDVVNIVKITQADYTALATKDSSTLYIITES